MNLYSGDILALAQTLRDEALAAHDASVRKVAKLCGSELELDVKLVDGRVAGVAQRVRACALGQASAAILQAGIVGADCAEIAQAREALHAMLKADGPPPAGRFGELAKLQDVRAYPARHTSVMLAWDAAVAACQEAR